jgi:hypothetical protein
MTQPRLIVKWNLPRLAAGLAAHLEALRLVNNLWDTCVQSEEYLEPYNLSPEDDYWVTMVAWGKQCVDCGDVRDYYMVSDRLWRKARLKPNQCCCSQCLEVRLGRALKPGEFTAIVSAAWARRQSRRA